MLSTTASRIGASAHPSAKCTSGGITPTCAALIRYREQQSRTFRFARIWASWSESEPHREVFRHHRRLRHKYAEALNRRLSWENHPHAEDAKRMLKSAMRDYWRHDCRPAARYVNTDARRKTPDNPTGVRPGNNIEDAERGAMEHLLFGHQSIETSTFNEPNRRRRKHHTSVPAASVEEVEYTIDAITNRKVPKTLKIPPVPDVSSPLIFDAGLESPAAKAYKSQFTPFNPPSVSDSVPIFYDGPPPEAELEKYGPVKLNTHSTFGHASAIVESEEYESNFAVSSQTTVTWHPIDSLAPLATNLPTHQEDAVQTQPAKSDKPSYEDLDKYADATPTQQQQQQPYDDLHKYKPVGLETEDVITTQPGQQYSDLTGYNTSGFRYLEPNGRPAAREQGYSASEVNQYQPFQLGQGARPVYEEPRDPAELSQYQPFGYLEPDCKPVSAEEASKNYDPLEVQQYQAFRYNEPDGKPAVVAEEASASYDPAEVQTYQAFMYNEPDGKPLSDENTQGYDPIEVQQYQQSSLAEADLHAILGQSDPDATELRTYGAAVKYNEPDGKTTDQLDSTARALKEFDEEQKQRMPYLEPTDEESPEDLESLRASDIRAKYTVTSNAVEQDAASSVKEATQMTSEADPQEKKLTGNYVRDFPEEFARSWTSTFQSEKPASPADVPLVQPSLDRSTPLQPALNRQAKLSPRPAIGDPFSKVPQGLEVAYEKECAADLDKPIFVKEYGTADTAHPPTTSETSTSSATAEPTLYKILAYDQTAQSISTAETTSHTSSAEPPLTPSEVLLRLSHPSKFIPHFARLQAEGYEIVSGSGDILVFRKATTPSTSPSLSSQPTSSSTAPIVNPAPLVNPIDMTGSRRDFPDPATSRFASPTGFVNYDIPAGPTGSGSGAGETVRRFVSGIDVRRQEPVFSGGSSSSGASSSSTAGSEGSRKKSALGKRMAVGAAWVAGASYALGVLGEYFTTGGADGLGPKGF